VDEPVVDALVAKVKAMLARGKRRGFVTHDELSQALPPEHYSSEQIEDTVALLTEMGIQLVEGGDGDDEDDDPVDVDQRSPRGPLPLRGEADPDEPPNTIDTGGPLQPTPTSSENLSGRE